MSDEVTPQPSMPILRGRLESDLDCNHYRLLNCEGGGGGSSIEIDDTLSIEGAAADAKATGNRLAAKLSRVEAEAGYTEWAVTPPTLDGATLGIRYDADYLFYALIDVATGSSIDTTPPGSYPADNATSLSFQTEVEYVASRVKLRPDIPVQSVNGKTGAVVLDAADVGALPISGGTLTGDVVVENAGGAFAYYGPHGITYGEGVAAASILFPTQSSGAADSIALAGDIPAVVAPTASAQPGAAADASQTYAALQLKAAAADLPYTLGESQVIDTASTDPQTGVTYGEVMLADRTANAVSITTAIDELRLMFPVATSGHVRDFELCVNIVAGVTAAPALAIIPPSGENIVAENSDGALPQLVAAGGVVLLCFSEKPPAGYFFVKGEELKEVLND